MPTCPCRRRVAIFNCRLDLRYNVEGTMDVHNATEPPSRRCLEQPGSASCSFPAPTTQLAAVVLFANHPTTAKAPELVLSERFGTVRLFAEGKLTEVGKNRA